MRHVTVGFGIWAVWSLSQADGLGAYRWLLVAFAVLVTAAVAERFPRD